MKKINWKKYLPDIIAYVLFVLIALIYASPILDGKILLAGDTVSGKGMAAEIHKYKEDTGKTTYWTGNMFSGMPTYQISGSAPSVSLLNPLMSLYRLNLPLTIGLIFIYLLGFYILMRSFNINKWLSIVGAIAIAFSSYFFIIIQAGHNNKVLGLAYMAPVFAGFMLLFRKKYAWGAILTLLFSAFGLMVHPQMTYYIFMLIGVMLFAELFIHIKEKRMKDFTITFNDYMNAQHLFLGWKRWIIQIAIIPVILFIFFNRGINYYSSVLISFILVLLAVFLVPSLNRKRLMKIYRSQPGLQKNTKVRFNEEYVEWITDSGSDRIKWNDIHQYKAGNNIIIILSAKNIMHPVPVSAFESKDELNRFLNLLKKNR